MGLADSYASEPFRYRPFLGRSARPLRLAKRDKIQFHMKKLGITFLGLAAVTVASAAPVDGWLHMRGPLQSGLSFETNLPDSIQAEDALWTVDLPGRSAPTISNGKLFIVGHLGEGADLQEGVFCLDAETGKKLWEHKFNDFLSDIIYTRYSSSSPTIDPETGNLFFQGTQGLFASFSQDGKILWKHSLMEALGRMTFPNGRTATPVVDKDLVITRGIMANWGAQGPPWDRFYGFDKKTGELVWAAKPGGRPKDSCFSSPYLGWLDGKRVFYATTGDGSVICANARTGEAIWQVPLFKAGINASVVVYNNEIAAAIYGTPYEPGQMVGLKIPKVQPKDANPVVVERKQVELWTQKITTSTSAPILVDDTIYVVAEKGELHSVNIVTGKENWKIKLGIEQRNASPVHADGKIYLPMLENPAGEGGAAKGGTGTHGAFYIIKPGKNEAKILSHAVLDGRCFATPSIYNGKVYVQTTKKLYCFGKPGNNKGLAKAPKAKAWPKAGKPTRLQIVPSEILLEPGESASFRARRLDANGFLVDEIAGDKLKWESYIPPTAKVKARMNASFKGGQIIAGKDRVSSAGAFKATAGGLSGVIRGRVLPAPPLSEDFEGFDLIEDSLVDEGVKFAYPPLPWIGARFKFEVRDREGTKALRKTVDNKRLQRATVFIGEQSMSNYTIQADVLTDGRRRKMSDVGIINQRYCVVLKGNEQKLEINSNLDRIRVPERGSPPNFRWKANQWFTLKARVDVNEDGSGMIRAKAWPRDEAEPDAWNVEFKHNNAHKSGSPGLFGFSPQEMPVYIDNVKVTPNK